MGGLGRYGPVAIRAAVSRRLDNPGPPPSVDNQSGDGRAAQAIAWLIGRAERPSEWMPGPMSKVHLAPKLSA